jgi:DNA-binding response OmpR family regulator
MSIRILYAEDDDASRLIIKEQLEAEGYAVDTAVDGEEAIALLGKQAYDLVLLDIKMPGKSGLEVLKHLRDTGSTARAIMLTAVNELSIAIQAVKLGANDYVTKPFQLDQLFGCIQRVLQR